MALRPCSSLTWPPVSECCLIKSLPYILVEKYIYIFILQHRKWPAQGTGTVPIWRKCRIHVLNRCISTKRELSATLSAHRPYTISATRLT